jgi:hypothetical protein
MRGDPATEPAVRPGQAIAARDEQIVHAPVAQIVDDTTPEPCSFAGRLGAVTGLGDPDAQRVRVVVAVDPDRQVGGFVRSVGSPRQVIEEVKSWQRRPLDPV